MRLQLRINILTQGAVAHPAGFIRDAEILEHRDMFVSSRQAKVTTVRECLEPALQTSPMSRGSPHDTPDTLTPRHPDTPQPTSFEFPNRRHPGLTFPAQWSGAVQGGTAVYTPAAKL